MKRWRTYLSLSARSALALLLCWSCFYPRSFSAEPLVSAVELPRTAPSEPAAALSSFKLRPGIRLDLIAAEPLVYDPIAMCFDEDARLFVVEMRDYSERRAERLGRIRMLEDTNEDGRMDRSTVFAEDLAWPTALIWYNGGLFVGSTPDILYFKDTDNDGKADERKVIFTGFGSEVKRLNVQALLNSFTWGLDNRIHGAAGGNGGTIINHAKPGVPPLALGSSDFSFDPRTFEMRRENGGGQFGLTFDNAGRKFICSNSAHIRQVMYHHHSVLEDMHYALPSPALDIPVDGANAPVYRISPDEPWRVLRTKWRVGGMVAGPVEGGGRPSGYFTSASGITIFRGTALGDDFVGDAFIADVGSNLIHRKKIRPNGVAFQAERAADERASEFIASRDLWFRPVAFANAPDGALYIADMYREVVEHPWSLPESIKQHLDLNAGNDRGRIYRVVSTNFIEPKRPRLSHASTKEIVAFLGHPNGWHRDTAARLIYEKHGVQAIQELRTLLRQPSPHGQLHALHALHGLNALLSGMDALRAEDIVWALRSPHATVREGAAQLMPLYPLHDFAAELDRLTTDSSARVRHQVAWSMASMPLSDKSSLLQKNLESATDIWERHAILAALSRDPSHKKDFPQTFTPKSQASSPTAQKPPVSTPRTATINAFSSSLILAGDAAQGRAIYLERCASCHRLFGQGTPVGPDLESVRTAGRETTLIHIIDPNREVQPRFATHEITTNDGEQTSGILVNDAPNGLSLRLANGVETFIPRTQIKSARTTTTSLMPEGLETGLNAQNLADLLTYLSGP